MTAFSDANSFSFSFLMPTRNRTQLVERFLRSVIDTTAQPDRIEVIIAVDEDDPESHKITHETLALKKVILPAGATMGNLNRACFDASSGRYVMLINDDVILRTKEWDLAVAAAFARYRDDVGLVHVNDLLFREKLCTFPILSRKTCLEIGICRSEYRRYKIDDDIYAIYNMLAQLGHKRITYLPEVIFEHENFEQLTREHRKSEGSLYIAEDEKVYLPNPEFHDHDARIFEARLAGRKRDAISLAALIDSYQSEEQLRSYERQLSEFRDPYDYRRPGFVTTFPAPRLESSSTRVTVAVVTSDIYKKHAQKCLAALKQHTTNVDLVILDNNVGPGFVHAREMNKVLRSVTTDFLVLLDDDVFVEAGWLDGLLAAMDEETGVIAPMHKDGKGRLSFSGVYMAGDEWGSHEHLKDRPAHKRECQCLCSAILLIDVRKCGNIFFDEQYRKYFFDLTHSFRVWEGGYKVVCTPDVIVTHLGGATMDYRSQRSQVLFNQDVQTFVDEWISTGRLRSLAEAAWSKYPELKELTTIPSRINELFSNAAESSDNDFAVELNELLRLSGPYKLFQRALYVGACEALKRDISLAKRARCEEVSEDLKEVAWMPAGPIPIQLEFYKGYELVEYGAMNYAVPVTLDFFVVVNEEARNRSDILKGAGLSELKETIDQTISQSGQPGNRSAHWRWQLMRMDKWLRKDRRNPVLELASRAYVQVPRRIVVALSIRWKRYAIR
jgi:GT2 family glycosyltransferase/glycosyltransferase involved in cell wall biosynthesis